MPCGSWRSERAPSAAGPAGEGALNPLLTPPRHSRRMTLRSVDGSSFSWQIANAAGGGFDASFRVERRAGAQHYTEADTRHTLSRETAVGWLRTEASIRGFDAREIR